MENTTEWKKGHSSDTKYPKKAFSGIISAMYPSSTESKNTPLLRVDFEDGKTISLFGLKVEEGEVKASMGLEEFLESLNKLGIEDFWATDPDQALGFRTEPNLVGCKVWMRPMENTTVGDQSQTQSSIFWGLLEKYEKPGTTKIPKLIPQPKGLDDETVIGGVIQQASMQGVKSPEGLAAIALYWSGQDVEQAKRIIPEVLKRISGKSKPKPIPTSTTPAKEPISVPDAPGTPGFDAVSALKDFLIEFLVKEDKSTGELVSDPKTEAAIMQAVKKLENGKQMNDVRKPVLGDITFIQVENGKYSLVV